jgi:5-methylcytosine-specific restriction endonuclease McrA
MYCSKRCKNAAYKCSDKGRATAAAYMREWYARNREKVREWKVRYGERKPTGSAERSRRYREQHRAEVAGRRREYREEHRAAIAERKRWHRISNLEAYRERERRSFAVRYAANPEAFADWARRRRALKKGAGDVRLTRREWEAITLAFDHRCAYCGARPARLEQDHVIPLTRGGQHTAANVVPACGSCNRRKFTSLGWKPSGALV